MTMFCLLMGDDDDNSARPAAVVAVLSKLLICVRDVCVCDMCDKDTFRLTNKIIG